MKLHSLMAYASWTGTRRNLDVLKAAGWGLLLSATGHHGRDPAAGFRYALDNGAWTAHQQKRPWDEAAFLRLVEKFGAAADFVVVPDIVSGGLASLERSVEWLPRLTGIARRLVPVQDGMEPEHVASLIGPDVGLFVGGSTPFKLTTMAAWAALARSRAAYCHVGRVNTVRRIKLCGLVGADSFDGTSATRWLLANLKKLENARRQTWWIA